MSQGKHVNMTEAAEEYYTFVFFFFFFLGCATIEDNNQS